MTWEEVVVMQVEYFGACVFEIHQKYWFATAHDDDHYLPAIGAEKFPISQEYFMVELIKIIDLENAMMK